MISRIKTTDGKKVLYVRPADPANQVIEPRNVAQMNTMMQETLLSGTAHKAELPRWQAAGKTGTSQDFRDAWFIGYTANLVTGVWLGNDDNSPTKKATGGGLPVEVWTRFMRAAHQNVPVAALPASDRSLFSNFATTFGGSQQRAGGEPKPRAERRTTARRRSVSRAIPEPVPQQSAPPPQPYGGQASWQQWQPPAGDTNQRAPEASAGLDGWLVDRLFGGRR